MSPKRLIIITSALLLFLFLVTCALIFDGLS